MLVPLYSEWQGQARTGQGISLFAGNPDTGFFCSLLSQVPLSMGWVMCKSHGKRSGIFVGWTDYINILGRTLLLLAFQPRPSSLVQEICVHSYSEVL
jgi:hypothetical protein